MRIIVVAAAVFLWSNAATALPDADRSGQLEQAKKLISDQHPAEAIVLLDRLIASDPNAAASVGELYCARGMTDTLMYMTEAATAKRSARAVDPSLCDAIFFKGFALIDVGKPGEARTYLERAVAFAPHNAYYRSELAESYKSQHDWDKALALFEQAADDARTFTPEDAKTAELSRAMRGMAFALSELGQLDEAQKLYAQCLQMNPNDEVAKSELIYIAQQRSKDASN